MRTNKKGPERGLFRRKNYEPGNVRLASYQTQNNNREITIYLEVFGEKKSMSDWAKDERCLVEYQTLARRINNNWEPERALTSPLYARN